MIKPPLAEKLSLKIRMLYGSGTIAFGIKDQGFNLLLMLFYNQVIGLPAAWVGSALMIAMVVDALFDPLLGHYSDNVRTRWGRRHPFMYVAALPVALSYLLLWSPPSMANGATFAWLVTSAIMVRVSLSLYEIPSTALLAELSSDYDERTKLVAARYFFAACGGVGMTALAFGYFLQPTQSHPVGQLNAAGYQGYAVTAAIIMTISMLISAMGTQKVVLSRPMPAPAAKQSIIAMFREMRGVFVHPAYVSILLASLFFAVASGLSLSLQVYFSTYFWELSSTQIATLASSTVVGLIVAFVVVLPLSARFGKKSAAIAMFLISATITAIPLLLRLSGHFPANGDPLLFPLLILQLTIVMMCTVSGGILAVSMVADVTDQIQLETGKQSEGLLFSLATMVNKAISGMGILLTGLILTFVHFPSNAQPGTVPENALHNLAAIFVAINSGATLLAVLCLYFYPITRARHMENLKILAAKPAE